MLSTAMTDCRCGKLSDSINLSELRLRTKLHARSSANLHCTRRVTKSFLLALLVVLMTFCWSTAHAQRSAISGVWKTGKWSTCEGDDCGPGGSQLRSVTCENLVLGYKTTQEHCDGSSKPPDQRTCFKVCEQHRDDYRWQIKAWRECRKSVSAVETSLSGVSNCGIHSDMTGSQTRNVFCISSSNQSRVVEKYVCETFNTKPNVERKCRVPCIRNCVTSTFGTWSACSRTCGNGTQTRIRSVLWKAKYGGAPCPPLREIRNCEGLAACGAAQASVDFVHKLQFGEWSVCKRAQANLKRVSRKGSSANTSRRLARINEHLIGARTRHVTCLDESGQGFGERFTVNETCAVAQACTVLSSWSDWSNCTSACGANGTQTRTRKVQRLPFGSDTSSCPKLLETRDCLVDAKSVCPSYRWASGGWSACDLIHNVSCGGGLQSRDVYCVLLTGYLDNKVMTALRSVVADGANVWSQMQPVDDAFCDGLRKLVTWRECSIPCRQRCVLGQWSDWSECALANCSAAAGPRPASQKNRAKTIKGFKRRVQRIYNDFGSPVDCPNTLEVIPCDSPRCYFWHVAHTLDCVPEINTCGKGTAKRSLECRDMWGEKVDDSMCLVHSAALPVARVVQCYVPCSQDCALSEWSAWTPCPPTCKRGKRRAQVTQTRKREILAHPGRTGTPCPREENLTESRRCDKQRCSVYFWQKSRWGPCQLEDVVATLPVEMPTGGMVRTDEGNSSAAGLVNPRSGTTSMCGKGYQTRTVKCRKKQSRPVHSRMCMTSSKPVKTRSCTIACRQNCLLSKWSTWSSCADACPAHTRSNDKPLEGSSPSYFTGLISAYQRRKRYVIQPRIGNGEPCRLELKQTKLCPDDQQCSVYKWHVHKWSPCVATVGSLVLFGDNSRCMGVKTRTVKCYRHTLANVGDAEAAVCLQKAGKIPHATKPCVTSCPRHVTFRDWLQTTGCRVPVSDDVTDDVTVQPEATANSSDDYETTYIPLQPISKPIGPWSSCFVNAADFKDIRDECPINDFEQLDSERKSTYDLLDPVCGTGSRKRTLGCFEEGTGVMLDISFCYYKAFEEEECEIPCPVDCVMSAWTDWGECGNLLEGQEQEGEQERPQPLCGNNLAIRYKFVRAQPKHGGRACPALDRNDQVYQSRPCHRECDETFWVTTAWDLCKTSRIRTPSCGSGIQTQTVDCYRTDRSQGIPNLARRQVDKNVLLCDVHDMPLGSRQCYLPCPGQCVPSTWSRWQPCVTRDGMTVGQSGTCDGAQRTRTRKILRDPDGIASSACAAARNTSETENCQVNVNCFTYSAKWTQWTHCLLGENAECGIGQMHRRANCFESTGLPVHASKCVQHNVSLPAPESRRCDVSCPTDCLVSQWSAWTTCSDKCNVTRARTRTREILRRPSSSGRLCPPDLAQTRPCCFKPCYAWNLFDWGACRATHGNCGFGTQQRIVKCVQQDGLVVDDALCKQRQLSANAENDLLHDWFAADQLSRACRVSCPGECQTTEWSVWSRCHADCELDDYATAQPRTGVKTRSRVGYSVGQVNNAECSTQEIDEVECSADEATCFTYNWKVDDYVGNKRRVWCERTEDKLRVSTGCIEELKPHDMITSTYCAQACSDIDQSYCTPEGVCACIEPYRAVHHDGYLHSCVDPQTQQDQGVTTEELAPRNAVSNKSDKAQPTTDSSVVIVPINETGDSGDFWSKLNPLKSDGSLKVWAYGAIAGLAILLVFLIATIYLIYSACRKPSKTRSRRRGKRQSGSNVGVGLVVTSGAGSSMFGTGGTGLPPYYTAPRSAASGAAHYPGMRALSRTPSAKSAAISFPDRYDSDD